MPVEMFGGMGGIRQWEQDALAERKTNVDIQKTLGELAMQPQKQELERQHARLYEAQANKAQEEARQEKRAGELAAVASQPGAAGQPGQGSVADFAERLYQSLMSEGMTTKGMAFGKLASEVRQRENASANSQANTQLHQLKFIQDRAALAEQIYRNATDEPTWRQAHEIWQARTGTASPYADRPFDQNFVQGLTHSALTAKERATLEEQRLAHKATEDYRKNRLKQLDLQNTIREDHAKLEREREDRLKKASGRRIAIEPKPAELRQVQGWLVRDYPFLENASGKNASARNDAVATIATEARDMMIRNPAISLPIALSTAYREARNNGSISVLENTWSKDEFSFRNQGRTPSTAIPLPTGAAAKDPKSYQDGAYYTNSKGAIGQFRGGKMIPVQGTATAAPPDERQRRSELLEEDR